MYGISPLPATAAIPAAARNLPAWLSKPRLEDNSCITGRYWDHLRYFSGSKLAM